MRLHDHGSLLVRSAMGPRRDPSCTLRDRDEVVKGSATFVLPSHADRKGTVDLLRPRLPDFDLDDWARRPYAERLRMMCQAWVLQGFGAPTPVYVLYGTKIALYVGVWLAVMAATPGLGGIDEIATWWAEPVAFQKAVVWTMLFEGLGLGAGSGPLTARYLPPFGGALYFLRPGATRLPPFPRLPLTGGRHRTLLDVGLYAALLVLAVRALVAPEITPGVAAPLALALPLLGLRDKTVFLAWRSEHYWVTLLVFLFPDDLLAGSKAVQLAIWWGAATSKLNRHFPSVIAVMVCNSPWLRWRRLRTLTCRDFPDDLRASRLAAWIAHGGTVVEYTFPLVLALSSGGWTTTVALGVMLAFHVFITSCMPLGVPLEWNVFFVYSMFVLFGVHAEVSVLSVSSPLLVAILVAALVVVPVLGNLFPAKISFLPSMRYYAGNWATSLWMFRRDGALDGQDGALEERGRAQDRRGGALDRLDRGVTKVAPVVQRQLERFYEPVVARALLGKALAFRSMHLHGRALNDLLRRAVDDPDEYEVCDGEWIAGVVLGWNFGDGHLHHEQLLAAVQADCGFAPGELRCVFLESQPFHRPALHWRIHDAADGLLEEGQVDVRDLLTSQPWPDDEAARAPSG